MSQHADLRTYTNPRNKKVQLKACPDCGAFEGYDKKLKCDSTRPNPIINMKWVAVDNVINFPQ